MLGICLQSEWVKEWGAITFFAALGIVVFLALGFTLFAHPLFAFDTGNIEWVRAWLWNRQSNPAASISRFHSSMDSCVT